MILEPHYSLAQAVEKFFPGGPITISSLRNAIRNGELQATMPQAFGPQGGVMPYGPSPYMQQPPPGYMYQNVPDSPYGMQPMQQAPMQQPMAPWERASPDYDPGSQMFGMGGFGALVGTRNPNVPPGAMIEAGYTIVGPDKSGMWTITRPNGQGSFQAPPGSASGAILDPASNQIVYQGGRASTSGITSAGVADVVTAATPIAQAVADAIARTQEARRGVVRGQPQAEAPSQGIPTWLMALGALGLGAGIVYAVGGKKKSASVKANPGKRRRKRRR